MYDFTQIKPFAEKAFPALGDKTVGEMTDEEAMQAHEDWLRAQFGHMQEYYRPHLSLLLHRLDELRKRLSSEVVRLPEAPEFTTIEAAMEYNGAVTRLLRTR